jgi:hypothetical protein
MSNTGKMSKTATPSNVKKAGAPAGKPAPAGKGGKK